MRVDAIAERTEGPSLALTVTRGMGSAFSVGGLNRPPPQLPHPHTTESVPRTFQMPQTSCECIREV